MSEKELNVECPAEENIASKVEGLKNKIDEERSLLVSEREELNQLSANYAAKITELETKLQEIGESIDTEESEDVVVEKKKVFKPKFEDLMALADSLKTEDTKVSGAIDEKLGTGTLKYYVGRTLFLTLQKTTSDYRVTFMALEKNVVKYLAGDKRFSIPKNAKSQNMIKFVNKGSAESGLVKGIVKESYKGLEEELARIQAAKDAAKEAKKQAKANAQ